jgi:IS30 family transposase
VIGQALDVLKTGNGALAKLRREDIQALRAAGLSYRQIGPAIGVHYSRVKQIESGTPTGSTARARAAREADDEKG